MQRYLHVSPFDYRRIQSLLVKLEAEGFVESAPFVALGEVGVTIPVGTSNIEMVVHFDKDERYKPVLSTEHELQ